MREKVLIIEDNRDLARLTSLWVTAAGYRAIIALDGSLGLAAAAVHRPDIILLDIMMPDLDGFEVIRQLKENLALAHIPVICISGKVQETARREAFAAGAAYFLSKPYESADLLKAMESALSNETLLAKGE